MWSGVGSNWGPNFGLPALVPFRSPLAMTEGRAGPTPASERLGNGLCRLGCAPTSRAVSHSGHPLRLLLNELGWQPRPGHWRLQGCPFRADTGGADVNNARDPMPRNGVRAGSEAIVAPREAARVIGVFLVSDVALHRNGLACLLDASERIRVLGAATPNQEAIAEVHRVHADVALLDLPPAKARSFARLLGDALPNVKCVAVGLQEAEEEVIACAEAGICAYVTPEASPDELATALEGAFRDELLCSPQVAGGLMRRVGMLARQHSTGSNPDQMLTPREREVLGLLGQGCSNKEIAGRLCIEVLTVKSHVHNIFEKLGVHRRAKAAAMIRSMSHGREDGAAASGL